MDIKTLDAWNGLIKAHGDRHEAVAEKTGYQVGYVSRVLSGAGRMSDAFRNKLHTLYNPAATLAAMSAALEGDDEKV